MKKIYFYAPTHLLLKYLSLLFLFFIVSSCEKDFPDVNDETVEITETIPNKPVGRYLYGGAAQKSLGELGKLMSKHAPEVAAKSPDPGISFAWGPYGVTKFLS